jgi:O-antigen ligase
MKILVFLWILVFAISMHTNARDLSQLKSNPIDNLRLIRIIVMGIVALWAIGPLFPMKKIDLALKPPMVYVLIYGLLALISVIYSPNKALTAWKSIEILVDTALATVIVYHLLSSGPKRFLDVIYIVLGLLVFVMEIEAIINPSAAFMNYSEGLMQRQLGGVYPFMNPIPFGCVCAFVSVISTVNLLHQTRNRDRFFYFLIFAMSTIGTLLSHARSAMIANFLGIMVILFLGRKYLLLVLSAGLILATTLVPQTQQYWFRTQNIEQLKDLSGRVSYWTSVLKVAKKSPIYGYGFYSAQRELLDSETTDNQFLDVFIGLGAIGVFVMVLMIIVVWKDAIGLAVMANRSNSPDLVVITAKIISLLTVLSTMTLIGRGFSVHGEAFMMFMTVVICIQALKYGEWEYMIKDETEDQLETAISS